jgi:hypothetical protein
VEDGGVKSTVFGLAALAFVCAGCVEPQPSPRGHPTWRPVVIVNAVTPALAVMQGEGGPVEVSVTNAGQIPVKVLDVVAEASNDDGAPFEAEGKGASPSLEPGEVAHATAIARPSEAGENVQRHFRVLYADGREGQGGAVKVRPLTVKLNVAPAAIPVEDARSRAKVGSQTPAVFSATLGIWGFERPDGIVVVEAQGEGAAWPGISLRAFAWVDLFVGNTQVRFLNEKAHDQLSEEMELLAKVDRPNEATIPDGAVAEFFAKASLGGFQVDVIQEGGERLLIVK